MSDFDAVALAGKKAKGKRPAYFDDPAVDRLLGMVLALAGEVAVLQERNDTVERLLDAGGVLRREDIETFRPDRDTAYARGLASREFVARIFRGVQQDMESLAAQEPNVEDVSRELREI